MLRADTPSVDSCSVRQFFSTDAIITDAISDVALKTAYPQESSLARYSTRIPFTTFYSINSPTFIS